MLTREEIVAKANAMPEVKKVTIPGLGEVCIRRMRGSEVDKFDEQTNASGKFNYINARARLVVKCLSDDQGNRLFTDAETDTIGKLEGVVLQPLYEECLAFNKRRAEDVKELAGNSPAAQSGDSGSNSATDTGDPSANFKSS